MKKSEVILIGLCSFFFGVVIGFLASPVKKGIEIGNNSGNTNNYYSDEATKELEKLEKHK